MASRRMSSKRTITGSLTDVQRRLKYVEGRSSPSRLANQVVQRTNVQPRAISTDQIALSSITNSLIEESTITSREISANAITNSELASNSVSTENFVVGAVDNSALGAKSVTQDKIDDNSVGTLQIINGAIDTDKLDNNAVTTSKILDGAIQTNKIDNFAVTTDKIGPGAIIEGKVGINAINSGAIQGSAITSAKISNGAVTSSKIGSSQVQTANIANLAVTGIKLANGSVTATKIATNAVGNNNIAPGTSIVTNISTSGGLSNTTTSLSFGIRNTLGVNFGGGSNQVPRGNHTHSINGANSATGGASAGTAHTHNYVFRAGLANAPSTKKVKTNISTHSIEDPKKILNLEPKKYKYKNSLRTLHSGKNREWMHGYIAEEVLELGLEEIVGYDKKGKPDSLDYSLISLFLVELAKVHESEINSLKEEIQRLKESK